MLSPKQLAMMSFAFSSGHHTQAACSSPPHCLCTEETPLLVFVERSVTLRHVHHKGWEGMVPQRRHTKMTADPPPDAVAGLSGEICNVATRLTAGLRRQGAPRGTTRRLISRGRGDENATSRHHQVALEATTRPSTGSRGQDIPRTAMKCCATRGRRDRDTTNRCQNRR